MRKVSYAVGEVVGLDGINSASRMNSEVIFLSSLKKVERVVEAGIVHFYSSLSLSKPLEKKS